MVAHSPLWEALGQRTEPHPLYAPAVLALVLLGVSANLTALRRIGHTLRALDGRLPATSEAAPANAVRVRRPWLAGGMEAGARRLLARLAPSSTRVG
jgi:hypothetical protein